VYFGNAVRLAHGAIAYRNFTGSPTVLAADTSAWRQAFSPAQYSAAEATPRAAGCLYGRKERSNETCPWGV